MAQFYTQEEAAQRLGISLDDFKRRIKIEWTSIRPFRDGSTVRFRTSDIDDLARSLGEASDPGLTLGPIGAVPIEDSSEDGSISLSPDGPLTGPTPKPKSRPKQVDDEPLLIGDDILGAFDSGENDSDVRLDFASNTTKADPQITFPTEEISVDLSGPSSAVIKPSSGSGKISAPKSGTKLAGPESGKIPKPDYSKPLSGLSKKPVTPDDSSSEFELSLDSSNDSLELEITGDSSDEVDLGGLGLAPNQPGQSGLNLGKPADSGISLEKRGPKTGPLGISQPSKSNDDDSDADFELSLDGDDSDAEIRGPRSAVMSSTGPASDSEFELTLDEDSGVAEAIAGELQEEAGRGDIFETDFEVQAVDDSESDLVAVDAESSDFDLDVSDMEVSEEESSSQVLLVDEDAEPIEDDDDQPRRRRSLAADELDDDLEEGASASGALRGVRRGYEDDEDGDTMPSTVVSMTPTTWGALPTIVLVLTLPLMLIGTLMSYENLRGMWGYHQATKPGSLIARPLAEEVFGAKLGD